MEEMQQHQGEWFFLHELNVDKVFSTIQRADYLILYYIKLEQETRPGEKLYLADLAAAMGLRVTELSKGIEKLQDSGFVAWKTDREAGRTYVELSSKAVELMAEEQALLQRALRAVFQHVLQRADGHICPRRALRQQMQGIFVHMHLLLLQVLCSKTEKSMIQYGKRRRCYAYGTNRPRNRG